MLVTAAVVPHPPLLVPDVAAAAAPELDDLRATCLEAMGHINRARQDGCDVVVVGGGPARETFAVGARGTFAGFGVPLDVTLPGAGEARGAGPWMPSPLCVAAWLMQRVGGWDRRGGSVRAEAVPFELSESGAAALGRDLATSTPRLALVVMGDGSNALSVRAPGYLVPGAEEWQSVATSAIADADAATLASLVAEDGRRFGAAGRAVWQVLAGAAGTLPMQGKLLATDRRYGVEYVVAQWSAAGEDT
jgi:hypothetical protein